MSTVPIGAVREVYSLENHSDRLGRLPRLCAAMALPPIGQGRRDSGVRAAAASSVTCIISRGQKASQRFSRVLYASAAALEFAADGVVALSVPVGAEVLAEYWIE